MAIILPDRYHHDFRVPNRKPVGGVKINRRNQFGRHVYFSTDNRGTVRGLRGSEFDFIWSQKHPSWVGRKNNNIYMFSEGGGPGDDNLQSSVQLPTLRSTSARPQQTIAVTFVPEYPSGGSYRSEFMKAGAALGFDAFLYFDDTCYIGYDGGNGYDSHHTHASLLMDQRNLLVISIDSVDKNMTTYLNGELKHNEPYDKAVTLIGGGTMSTTGYFGIATGGFSNYRNFKGAIEQVALFDCALTPTEITALCKNTNQVWAPAAPKTFSFGAAAGGGGPTPISADFTLQWHLQALLQSNADLQWSLSSALNKDSTLQWQLLNRLQKSETLQWRIQEQVQSALTTQWDLSGKTGSNLAIPWDLLTGVSVDDQMQWSILSAIVDNLELPWDIRQSLIDNTELQWQILATLLTGLEMQWSLRHAVATDADFRWQLIQALSADSTLQWDTAGRVERNCSLIWDILSTAGIGLLDHNGQSILDHLNDPIKVIPQLVSDLGALWGIQERLDTDAELRWSLANQITSQIAAHWDVLMRIEDTDELRWAIIERLLSDVDYRWDMDGVLRSDMELRWTLLQRVYQSLSSQWDLLELTGTDVDCRWALLAAITSQLEAQWHIAGVPIPIDIDFDLRWALITRTDNELMVKWAIDSDRRFEDLTGIITVGLNQLAVRAYSATPIVSVEHNPPVIRVYATQ